MILESSKYNYLIENSKKIDEFLINNKADIIG